MSSASKNETLINGATLSMSIQVKKEVVDHDESSFRRNIPQSSLLVVENRAKRTRTSSDDESSPFIMHKAKEVQTKLNPQFPNFIKMMRSYHITDRWMTIPAKFYEDYMPKNDWNMTLVGEDGEEFCVQFLANLQTNNPAFCSGWGSFVCKHNLEEGDALIFQLVSPIQFIFKVHIVRRNAPADYDGTLNHENLSANANESNFGPSSALIGYSDNSENHGIDSGTFVDLQSFTIIVKGFDIASRLSEDIRRKYYELCLSRKLNLHEHLLGTVKPSFAAELISGTIDIVDLIQECGVFTSEEEFVVWDKALESFELLGMDVGFLRSRLNQLKQKKHVFETEIENHMNELKAKYDFMLKEAARAAW